MYTQDDHTDEKNTARQGERRTRRKREEYGPEEGMSRWDEDALKKRREGWR